VCKIGTGFSDENLELIHKRLVDLEVDKPPSDLKFREKNVDTWIKP